MASDDAYANFLDKANEDPSTGSGSKPEKKSSAGGGGGGGGGGGEISTQAVTTSAKDVPSDLKALVDKGEYFYVSDTDEPFEVVSLKFDSEGEVDDDKLAELIGHKDDVSTISAKQFDPQGQYKEVLSAVEKASSGGGKVKIFRVAGSKTRVEYWVVGVQKGGSKVVGLKAKAVES